MKFICLGYAEPGKFENLPESERNAFIDECFRYDDVLRKNGHFAGGEALHQPAQSDVRDPPSRGPCPDDPGERKAARQGLRGSPGRGVDLAPPRSSWKQAL